jgi:hypothetical protein
MVFKNIFFTGHLLLMKSSLWFIYKPIILLNGITICSWYYNDNKCLLTQIEDKLFGETLIEQYHKIRGKHVTYSRFTVPWYHRYFMYTQFTVGILYHFVVL